MIRMFCGLRGNHRELLLYFESMVKPGVIFYLRQIDGQAHSQ
jgi:hypothetical protein